MSPRFRPGDRVRVDNRAQPGHVRTPGYVKDRAGSVLEICGAYPDPEKLAEGKAGTPHRYLYRVIFEPSALWPDDRQHGTNRVVVDLYEHWLSPTESAR